MGGKDPRVLPRFSNRFDSLCSIGHQAVLALSLGISRRGGIGEGLNSDCVT